MYKKINNRLKFLLIQRKDTMGYIDLLRGRYNNKHKSQYIQNFIEEITVEEKRKLLTHSFDELWDNLWVNHNSKMYINDRKKAKEKYQQLDLKNILSEFQPRFIETEYGFPKGRRHNAEEDGISCARRELFEETGIPHTSYRIRYDIPALNESFIGSNGVRYIHVYYVAECDKDLEAFVDRENLIQIGEVKKIGFYSLQDCIKKFRPYDTTKKSVLIQVWSILSRRFGFNEIISEEFK
jgi:8-oxo-dGTP pyrophosphatase MutT (NUDIX family)